MFHSLSKGPRWPRAVPRRISSYRHVALLTALAQSAQWRRAIHVLSQVRRCPKLGVPQNGWFIVENPMKMDGLRVPPFQETLTWEVWPKSCGMMGELWNKCGQKNDQNDYHLLPSAIFHYMGNNFPELSHMYRLLRNIVGWFRGNLCENCGNFV